jgi:hypothetical protein
MLANVIQTKPIHALVGFELQPLGERDVDSVNGDHYFDR